MIDESGEAVFVVFLEYIYYLFSHLREKNKDARKLQRHQDEDVER